MPTQTLKDVHLHFHLPPGLGPFLHELMKVLKMNMTDLETALNGVVDGLTTVGTNLVDGSAELTKALNEIVIALANQGGTTPAVDAAVAKLQTVATSLAGQAATVQKTAKDLDDLNQDLPTP